MKLSVEHILPMSPLEALELFDSDAFRARMNERAVVTSQVLETRTEGAVRVRVLRFTGKEDLPAIARKVMGAPRLTYLQTNRTDPAKLRIDWKVEIPGLDRFFCKGQTVMTAHPEGCRRLLDGVLEVRVPLVGGQIEKAIGPDFERSLARAAEIAIELAEEARSGGA